MDPFISAAADINVDEIMAAIRKKIQDKKDSGVLKQSEIDEISEMELLPLPDFLEIPNAYEPHLYPGAGAHAPIPAPSPYPAVPAPGQDSQIPLPAEEAAPPLEAAIEEKGLLKGILKKIRRALFPLIRFMTRPLYLELQEPIVGLQRKQEHMFKYFSVFQQNADYVREYVRLLYNSHNDLISEASKLKTYVVEIQNSLAAHNPITLQSSEYIRLLHNALNNMIVEATKLKTEEEMLKTKIKILEDKMEFLENRERALEKKLPR